MYDIELQSVPFPDLKRHASQRATGTVDRRAAAAVRAASQKLTAGTIKQATRELEPGFARMSFQVIRRIPVPRERLRQGLADGAEGLAEVGRLGSRLVLQRALEDE